MSTVISSSLIVSIVFNFHFRKYLKLSSWKIRMAMIEDIGVINPEECIEIKDVDFNSAIKAGKINVLR